MRKAFDDHAARAIARAHSYISRPVAVDICEEENSAAATFRRLVPLASAQNVARARLVEEEIIVASRSRLNIFSY